MANYSYCNNVLEKSVSGNFTYVDTTSEASMASASVFMFVLAGFFFNLNLFGGLSNVGAILGPRVRLLFTSSLSLFLPVMSYLFSEAKNTATVGVKDVIEARMNVGQQNADLSFMAGVILIWMLLVELIRKKVDEIAMRGYSGTIHRAGRVAWLGGLVFFNIHSSGRRAVFGVLWVLCATKLVQRIAFTEVGKRSYSCGKNPRIITSYMSSSSSDDDDDDSEPKPQPQLQPRHHQRLEMKKRIIQQQGSESEDAMLKLCRYIVMGEEDLDVKATADGYKVRDTRDSLVTVGDIWLCDDDERKFIGDELRRLSLSFALFKLLRRRFEHLPEMSAVETNECRDIIFKGLYKKEGAAAVFEVMNSEINFLIEYYHSVVPVVLASPFFFLANYFLLPVVVAGVCLMTVILCGGGDVQYIFGSINKDNSVLSSGILNTTICLLLTATKMASSFFGIINLAVTFLLYTIYVYEEVWEFFVFLLSNWFAVSLLCDYVAKRRNSAFRAFLRCVMRVRRCFSSHPRHSSSFKQFSALNLRWPPLNLAMPTALMQLLVSTKPVPIQVKHSILNSLAVHCGYVVHPHPPTPLPNDAAAAAAAHRLLISNGTSGLAAAAGRTDDQLQLSRACKSDSIAELILIWHIATGLLERTSPPKKMSESTRDHFIVATTLSRYCAYLVAFQPDLLPDYSEKVEELFVDMKTELKDRLGCYHYYFSQGRKRANAIVKGNDNNNKKKKQGSVHEGAELATLLQDQDYDNNSMWKLLAEVWTEMVVYVAPSNEEERIMAHKNVLWQGGEFVTVLWALMTHTGITRDRHEIAVQNHP
uniref:DUF4220 domain-containing protein n=1 Tax=Oryza rufipogon TaxID=4529 RepID=A0A0E0PSQ9_ORYRU